MKEEVGRLPKALVGAVESAAVYLSTLAVAHIPDPMVVLLPILLVLLGIPRTGAPECGDEIAIGEILEIKNVDAEPVEIRRADQSVWMTAERGMRVCARDQIRTRFRSKARVRLEDARSRQPIDVIVGVNTRVQTLGPWDRSADSSGKAPVLDVIHGVVSVSAQDGSGEAPHYVKTGPVVCRFTAGRVLSNWDPFKRESNHLVREGQLDCAGDDSTAIVVAGKSLEVIRGEFQAVRPPVPLVLESFSNATRLN